MQPLELPDITQLLDRYERPLVAYAKGIVGDLDSARDVVQEVFIRWARRGAEWRDKGVMAREVEEEGAGGAGHDTGHRAKAENGDSIAAWLYTATRNRAIDHHRKHSRIVPMEIGVDAPCEAKTPSAALESRDTEASLLRLVAELPPNQRDVITLKFQHDLSYREIAAITQLSETNVGFLLHTGLKKLRTLVAAQPREDFGYPVRTTSV